MRDINGIKERLAEIGIKPENSTFTFHDAIRAFELGKTVATEIVEINGISPDLAQELLEVEVDTLEVVK